jgi:hypothetical protein
VKSADKFKYNICVCDLSKTLKAMFVASKLVTELGHKQPWHYNFFVVGEGLEHPTA